MRLARGAGILLLVVSFQAAAQITISNTDLQNYFATGTSWFHYAVDGDSALIDVGTASSSIPQSWTIPARSWNSSWRIDNILPSSTPYSEDFPNASYAQRSIDSGSSPFITESYEYFGVSNDTLYSYGTVHHHFGSDGGLTIDTSVIAHQSVDLIVLPIALGNTVSHSDSFEIGPGTYGKETWTKTVDAYGTLTLPFGSVSALRERETHLSEVYSGGSVINSNASYSFHWYTKEGAQVHLQADTGQTGSGMTRIQSIVIVWVGPTPVAEAEDSVQTPGGEDSVQARGWYALGDGVTDGNVYSLLVSGSDVYVGGSFKKAGGLSSPCIAKWDGSTWTAMPGLLLGDVQGIVEMDGTLYIGGNFVIDGGPNVGGIGVNVAKWTGTAWSKVGKADYHVWAIAVLGDDLYAAGDFSSLEGISTKGIAKWNGSNWSDVGGGITSTANYTVSALAVSGSVLYAAGGFTEAGGVGGTRHVAKWDGISWSALGDGQLNGTGELQGDVSTVKVSGSDVYIGGSFSINRNGSFVYDVAKWNESAWSAVGAAFEAPDPVYDLVVKGSHVYAVGGFQLVGGNILGWKEANYIARWDGTNWLGLGGGTDQAIEAVAVDPSDGSIFIGGYFTSAGDVSASRVARIVDSGTGQPTLTEEIDRSAAVPSGFSLSQNFPNPFNPSTTIRFAIPNASNVTVTVFNVLGQEVARLAEGKMEPGYQAVSWHADVPSGVYFYRISANSVSGERFVETRRMILLK